MVAASALRTFAAAVLEAAGMPRPDAATLAEVMVWSDLRGITKQGVLRLPLAVERMRAGGTRPDGESPVLRETASLAAIEIGRAHV